MAIRAARRKRASAAWVRGKASRHFWNRHRAALVAGSLTLTLITAAIGMTGLRLAEMVSPSVPAMAAAERLLLAIEKDSTRVPLRRLAEHLPSNLAAPADIRRAIAIASSTVSVDAGYLVAVAARESSFDATARAQQSTALGLYQFTEETWLRVIKLFGERHGLGQYARQIDIDDTGTVAVPNARQREQLLRLRRDPLLSALMAAELAIDNKTRLERMLGRRVSPAETYIAHFLGVAQAAKMIALARSAPETPGSHVLPVAADSNPGIFGDGANPASVGAIVAEIDAYFKGTVSRVGS